MGALAFNRMELSIPFIIVGVISGIIFGRVAGGCVKRKLSKTNTKIRHIYRYMFDSYLKTIKKSVANLALDVNSTRILLEDCIDKFRLPLYLAKDEKNSEFFELLFDLEKILSSPKCFNAINLSWKLFLIECKQHIAANDISR